MYTKIVLLVMAVCLLGCQAQTQESPKLLTSENFQSGPQLVKISLEGQDALENLEAQDIEIIVKQTDYIIARVDFAKFGEIQAMSFSIQKPKENELVQRLIAVIVADTSQAAAVNNSGVNIWETHGDSVVAQAFDNQIEAIKDMGISVEILEDDIQNIVKKLSEK